MVHIPVLADEVIEYLNIQTGKIYFDGTLGAAGHSRMILGRLNGTGHLYSWDQDRNVIEQLQRIDNQPKNWTLVNANFEHIKDFCLEHNIKIDGGILLDLGFSSLQMDDPSRGLSFQAEGPLDMRLDPSSELTAEFIVNKYRENELADIIYQYGEERLSRQIAAAIVRARPIYSTTKLAEVIKGIYIKGAHGKTFRINPATRTFQALRIAVNRELEVLENFLKINREIFSPGARIAIISFHSLEDRIVKNAFRKLAREDKILEILTPKPISATEAEIEQNPRSRSAKLRVAMIV